MDQKVWEALNLLRRKLDREFHYQAVRGAKEMEITLKVTMPDASYMIIGLEDLLAREKWTPSNS